MKKEELSMKNCASLSIKLFQVHWLSYIQSLKLYPKVGFLSDFDKKYNSHIKSFLGHQSTNRSVIPNIFR